MQGLLSRFVTTLDLVGLAEIGAMLGVSRQRVDQLARSKGFPDPVATISAGRIWLREEVERWAEQTGREVVGRAPRPPS